MTVTENIPSPTRTDPAAAIIDRTVSLLEDLKLEEVRRYKQAHPGALAIGIMPVYAPRPLFEAMGVLPVHIYGGGQVDIIRGDSYFQSYICHIPRSVVELGMNGSLDALDGMIFPSTCDVIRNLSGMWKMLFPDKYSAYLDLPQNFEPSLGGVFYRNELRRIATELQERGARPLETEALRRAVEWENRRRDALEELDTLRRKEPWRVRASEAYLLGRAGGVMDAAAHVELLRQFLDAARRREARAYDNVRVVVVGAFCEQPPLGLIRTLEKSGCDLVEDDFQLGLRCLERRIPLTAAEAQGEDTGPLKLDDPLDALAWTFIKHGAPTATRYIGNQQKGQSLVERVRRTSADGVIFAAPSFCDPALLDQPMLEHALDEAEIPHTSFKYSENSAQFQTIREQAGAFSDSVKLWGNA